MSTQHPYRVLLFYKYVHIDNPEEFAAQHLEWCKQNGLRGRVLVAKEGINGTVSGTVEQTEAYQKELTRDPRFADVEFKIDPVDHHVFRKMFVRARKEIVTWRLEDDVDPSQTTGRHLSPQEWREALQQEDVIIIDGRNDYEYDIGHFKGALRPEVKTTKEFPDWVRKNLAEHKDKKILMYCTGGIRCEKFSGFMLQEGFADVNQLHGGIIKYSKDEEVQGDLFDGKCYVFDERISVPINRREDRVIGTCHHCGKAEDRYVNCANPFCHLQHICCEECETKFRRSCSDECREHPANRYDLDNEILRKREEEYRLEKEAGLKVLDDQTTQHQA
ncbi:rhodanese-related sulfurtransferase [Tumebacillus lipolyticus]|uniref:tRNA uridine(34) hydroxylase n=1 Tax=Tumebacillus lipolyticus TaxID=1280370 RepID=A0ABW4ZXA6_9BACL